METMIGSVSNAYPVGSVYFTTIRDLNPATLFGGTWELIGTKLAVREGVYGDGKALTISDGTNIGNMMNRNNPNLGSSYYNPNKNMNLNAGYSTNDTWFSGDKHLGLPTKALLSSKSMTSTGLIVDTEEIYSWKKTA